MLHAQAGRSMSLFQHLFLKNLADEKRLNYLHLMNKAAKSEDRQSYFHYLKQAEKALKDMGKTNAWLCGRLIIW